MEFMHDMPVRKLPGVGKVNERLLDSIGVKVSDRRYSSLSDLISVRLTQDRPVETFS